MSEQDKEALIKEAGEASAKSFLDMIDHQRKGIDQNPKPWKWYFEDGQIIGDLNNLIKCLLCCKGATEIFLTAG